MTARAEIAVLIDLGHALELEAIAEGVETQIQLQVLRDVGCNVAQGWLFTPAIPASEIDHLAAGARLTSVGAANGTTAT